MTPSASILHVLACNVKENDLLDIIECRREVGIANMRYGTSAQCKANSDMFNACQKAIDTATRSNYDRDRLETAILESAEKIAKTRES